MNGPLNEECPVCNTAPGHPCNAPLATPTCARHLTRHGAHNAPRDRCQHPEGDACRICGECREDLNEDDYCPDCATQ